MYNSKLEDFKKYIRNKKVAFIGIGMSNLPAMKYVNKLGAIVTAFDRREAIELDDICIEIESLGINMSLGKDYLENLVGFDLIFRSPSARPDQSEIIKEVERGAILTSEIELVMDMCPGKIIGITGSAGKTTTTTLIYEMLKEEGKECFIGGNIGYQLFDKIEEMNEESIVVLELSSFQLMTMEVSPHISVITSLAPDHLDIHKSIEEYYESKKNIYRYQKEDDILVLNYDDIEIRNMKNEAKGKVKFFSSKEKLTEGIILDDNKIKIAQNRIRKHIVNVQDVNLLGEFNYMNLCAAMIALEGIVSFETMQKVAMNFSGVEHRMEIVGRKNGVTYVNNSIASSPIKAASCLKCFDKKVIAIVGGLDRGLDFKKFAVEIINNVKVVILCGQTKEKIKQAINEAMEKIEIPVDLKIIECEDFYNVVKIAQENANVGDYVVLAPGAASFDQFENYKEKGELFKKLIDEI